MRSTRRRRTKNGENKSLSLPSSNFVEYFREKRLLMHLHEQLEEQIQLNPSDWTLHFQIANLLAFSDESFYKNRQIDVMAAEHHYQTALQLLQQVHEQSYIIFHNQLTPTSPLELMGDTEFGATVYSESNTKSIRKSLFISKSQFEPINIKPSQISPKSRKRNKAPKKQNKRKQYGLKKRKLLILVHRNDNSVSNEIRCEYTEAMSQEEADRERQRKMIKKTSYKKMFKKKVCTLG